MVARHLLPPAPHGRRRKASPQAHVQGAAACGRATRPGALAGRREEDAVVEHDWHAHTRQRQRARARVGHVEREVKLARHVRRGGGVGTGRVEVAVAERHPQRRHVRRRGADRRACARRSPSSASGRPASREADREAAGPTTRRARRQQRRTHRENPGSGNGLSLGDAQTGAPPTADSTSRRWKAMCCAAKEA